MDDDIEVLMKINHLVKFGTVSHQRTWFAVFNDAVPEMLKQI